MAIPPYMLKRLSKHYESAGESDLAKAQKRSDSFASTPLTLIGSHNYTYGLSSLPNRQVRFIRPGDAKTIEVQILFLMSVGFGELISTLEGDKINVSPFKKLSDLTVEEQNDLVKTLSTKENLLEEVKEEDRVVGLNIFSSRKE